MRGDLRQLLTERGGVLRREEALPITGARSLQRAVRRGDLARPLPGVLADPRSMTDPETWCRAALLRTGGRGALSHLTAVHRWGLPTPQPEPVHVTVPRHCQIRSTKDVTYHRRHNFCTGPPLTLVRAGLPVVRLERAVVESWPLLHGDAQRALALVAVSERRTTPGRLRAAARAIPNLPGSVALECLLDLLEAGCLSPMELWGCQHVFRHPSLPEPRRQAPVQLEHGTVYLDMLYERELVNVELDGAAYHSEDAQRERDIRRDAALTARGIIVVRYSPPRLYLEPEQVRHEVATILATRRHQLRLG